MRKSAELPSKNAKEKTQEKRDLYRYFCRIRALIPALKRRINVGFNFWGLVKWTKILSHRNMTINTPIESPCRVD
jgi:hypothetical protein